MGANPNLNRANRQVCDLDIRSFKEKVPFLYFNTANVTTANITSNNVYARAKGTNRIGFADPPTGTLGVQAQVYNTKFLSLLADGTIKSDAVFGVKKTVECTAAGKIALTETNGTIQSGTIFVYPEGSYGDDTAVIEGTYATGEFSATTAADIVANSKYEVGYIVSKSSGVKRVSFTQDMKKKSFYITAKTFDKNEDEEWAEFNMVAYKALPQGNLDISLSSDGDPVTITVTFDLSADEEGNVFDMIEIENEE